MDIRMVDLTWQHQQVRAEIDRVFDRILRDPDADTTRFVKGFEDRVSRLFGQDIHAVGVQSGLAAQFLILKALDIGPGDEVITIPNSDLATTAAVSHCGAQFVLADIDPRTHNLDPAGIEQVITSRTRAIIPVHLYGLPAEMDAINDIAQRHGLLVIEDATLAIGAEYRGVPAGALADASFLSFATGKILAGTSNGGMVVTRDRKLANRVRLLRGYGQSPARTDVPPAERRTHPRFEHLVEGYNLKLDGMQAALLGVKLDHLDEWRKRRQVVADRYRERLSDIEAVSLPHVPTDIRHAWRNYVVNVSNRDRVRAFLARRGIPSSVHYIPPVHRQPVYAELRLDEGSFPNAERDAETLLCLPMHPGLSVEDVDVISATLLEAIEHTSVHA